MIRVQESLICDWSPEDAFSFIGDFQNLPDWDPGIASSKRLDSGPLGVGSIYHVVAKFMGARVSMEYEVTRFEPPKRIVLEGRGMNLHAIDDIRFDATGTGTRVQYRADFRFLGSMRWAETIMKPAFNRIAERAMNGMKEALSRRAA
jgi:carbon monoxide dehydrogenase subunit G